MVGYICSHASVTSCTCCYCRDIPANTAKSNLVLSRALNNDNQLKEIEKNEEIGLRDNSKRRLCLWLFTMGMGMGITTISLIYYNQRNRSWGEIRCTVITSKVLNCGLQL